MSAIQSFGELAGLFAASKETDTVNMNFGSFTFPVTAAGTMKEFVDMMRLNGAVVLYTVEESPADVVTWKGFSISGPAAVLRWFLSQLDAKS